MSAFGKRGGIGGGGRPQLRRRQADEGRPGGGSSAASDLEGGDQFPPLEELDPPVEAPIDEDGDGAAPDGRDGPPDRAPERQRRAGQQQGRRLRGLGPPDQGAGASAPARARRPRSRGDAQQGRAGRGIPPDHLARCSTELKINLNRREQFALEKVLVDELLGLGPLEELLADPAISDIMVNGPEQTLRRAQGQARDRADPVPRRGASVPDRPAHRQQGRPPHRPDQPAVRRPPPGRQPRQRHHSAAVAARHRHLDP